MNPIISLQESNDETLVQLYQETSNNQIIGILYQRYASQVKKHCLQYLKDEASSEDALMDIFEQLVQKLKMYKIQTFKTWIFFVTRNYCMKQFRNRKYYQPVDSMSDTIAINPGSTSEPRDAKIIQLGQAINRLKPQQRQCIELFFFQKLSYAEIAEQVNCDIKKVKSHIQNGKLRLKNMLAA